MNAPVRFIEGTMEMLKEAEDRIKAAKKRAKEANKRAEEALAATLAAVGVLVDMTCEQSSDPGNKEGIWDCFWSTIEGTGKNTMSREEARNLFEAAWKNRKSAEGPVEE